TLHLSFIEDVIDVLVRKAAMVAGRNLGQVGRHDPQRSGLLSIAVPRLAVAKRAAGPVELLSFGYPLGAGLEFRQWRRIRQWRGRWCCGCSRCHRQGYAGAKRSNSGPPVASSHGSSSWARSITSRTCGRREHIELELGRGRPTACLASPAI